MQQPRQIARPPEPGRRNAQFRLGQNQPPGDQRPARQWPIDRQRAVDRGFVKVGVAQHDLAQIDGQSTRIGPRQPDRPPHRQRPAARHAGTRLDPGRATAQHGLRRDVLQRKVPRGVGDPTALQRHGPRKRRQRHWPAQREVQPQRPRHRARLDERIGQRRLRRADDRQVGHPAVDPPTHRRVDLPRPGAGQIKRDPRRVADRRAADHQRTRKLGQQNAQIGQPRLQPDGAGPARHIALGGKTDLRVHDLGLFDHQTRIRKPNRRRHLAVAAQHPVGLRLPDAKPPPGAVQCQPVAHKPDRALQCPAIPRPQHCQIAQRDLGTHIVGPGRQPPLRRRGQPVAGQPHLAQRRAGLVPPHRRVDPRLPAQQPVDLCDAAAQVGAHHFRHHVELPGQRAALAGDRNRPRAPQRPPRECRKPRQIVEPDRRRAVGGKARCQPLHRSGQFQVIILTVQHQLRQPGLPGAALPVGDSLACHFGPQRLRQSRVGRRKADSLERDLCIDRRYAVHAGDRPRPGQPHPLGLEIGAVKPDQSGRPRPLLALRRVIAKVQRA